MPKADAEVRLALPSDEPELMAVLRAFCNEAHATVIDEPKARYVLRNMIIRNGGVVGVIRGKSHIEGAVGLCLDSHWCLSSVHLRDLWLYVLPDYRKTTHAKVMLEFSKRYSDEIGIPLLANPFSSPETEALVRLYGRQLPEAGKVFLYDRRQPIQSATVVAA